MQLTFTIPDTQAQRIIDTMKNLYAIPQVPVDPADPGKGMKNQFTDAQWAKECVRRWIVEQVQKWENLKAAVQVIVTADNSIIS